MAGRVLARVLKDFPHITVEKVEFLTNMGKAKREGVRSIPALVAGDRVFSGILMREAPLREFLATL